MENKIDIENIFECQQPEIYDRTNDNELARVELAEEILGTRDGVEDYILCGCETKEEWLRWQELDLRKRALLKLRREIADVFTTFTCGLACFLACITSLEEESKVQLSALLDIASETMMRFGTPDEPIVFKGPLPFASVR